MSQPRREVLAEGVELWCGDCLEVLPTLGRFDALISDPPYGIGFVKGAGGLGAHNKRNSAPIVGDNEPFNPEPFLGFPEVILWGATTSHSGCRMAGGWPGTSLATGSRGIAFRT